MAPAAGVGSMPFPAPAPAAGAMAELLAASPSVEPRSQLGGGDDGGVSLWLPAELEGGELLVVWFC